MTVEKKESQEEWCERHLTKYAMYSRDIKRLLIACGIWPSLDLRLQRAISYSALATLLFGFFGTLNFSLHNVMDLMVFTKTIGLAVSLPGVMMKVYIFLSYRDDLARLNDQLSACFDRDLENKDYQPRALHYYQSFANLFYTLTTVVGVTCLLYFLIPILALMHGKYVTASPTLLPFSYEDGSLVYWLIQILYWYGSYLCWTVTCSVDSVFGLYALQMCGEFRVLAYKFENLKTSMDYQKEIKECLQRHYMLMRSMDTLQKVFSTLVLWLAITSAVIQCALVFQMSVMPKANVAQILYVVAYISIKLVQAFMYAWYGNLITDESQLCLDAIYNASWAGSGNKQLMNDVLIILSQRPLVFMAKGCLQVKMEMFLKVLHAAASYFFLLQALKTKSL